MDHIILNFIENLLLTQGTDDHLGCGGDMLSGGPSFNLQGRLGQS